MKLIAGPCSIESCEQLRQVVQELGASVDYVRGGVWKPRSRPGGFEGHGEEALQWVEAMKQEFPQARFCTEVATPQHVELCLKHGIDALWIGSRTTGNPFSVGELCQALRGCRMPIGVKNPMMPDAGLWLGAIERVQQAGVGEVAAIHRGFSPYRSTPYRNEPLWEIPIELRRLRPDLPLLCDPSHIAGRRDLVSALAQVALDLDMDGLMLEVHPQPTQALTDSAQQLTPAEFFALLATLRPRQEAHPTELTLLRQQIDQVDSQLIALLADRLAISQKIARVKADHNMAVYQPRRWEEVLRQKLLLAQQAGLDPDFIKEIYGKIHAESVRVQLEQ